MMVFILFVMLCATAGFLTILVLKQFIFELNLILRVIRIAKIQETQRDSETVEFFSEIARQSRVKRYQITTYKGDSSQ